MDPITIRSRPYEGPLFDPAVIRGHLANAEEISYVIGTLDPARAQELSQREQADHDFRTGISFLKSIVERALNKARAEATHQTRGVLEDVEAFAYICGQLPSADAARLRQQETTDETFRQHIEGLRALIRNEGLIDDQGTTVQANI